MKLTVLVDNNTLIDRYFLAEPGVSFFIEDDGVNILFDTGYSEIFLTNGEKMGFNFFNIDYLVLSHSHVDHTWGLEPLVKRLSEEITEGRSFNRAELIAHPDVFKSRSFTGVEEIGMNVDKAKLLRYFANGLSEKPVWLTKKLVFLGAIPRNNQFESLEPIGKVLINGDEVDDFNLDDSALCYKSDKGLVIITGCSHAGICNIISYAKEICQDNRIEDVIGGFHLQEPSKVQMDGTIDYFKHLNVKKIHACHCTDLTSKIKLAQVVEVGEVGVGFSIEY